jgi:hypothetical protein
MPINNNASVNPTSTVETYGPSTRDYADANTYVFKALAASGVCTLPKIETYPAAFVVSGTGTTNQPVGMVHVTAAGTLVLSGASASLATAAGANVLVPAVSSGILTLTANATWTARDITVTRVG